MEATGLTEEYMLPRKNKMTRERLQMLADTVMLIKKAITEERHWDAFVLASSIIVPGGDTEEQLYLSLQLDAKERNILKTYQEAERRAQRG